MKRGMGLGRFAGCLDGAWKVCKVSGWGLEDLQGVGMRLGGFAGCRDEAWRICGVLKMGRQDLRDGLIKLQHEIFSSSAGAIQGEQGAVCRGDGSPFHCDICEQ